jgi:polyferredoxin
VLVPLLVFAGVALLPLPALVAGCRGAFRRPGLSPDDPSDRASIIVLIALRLLTLILVFLLSGLTLLSVVGALLAGVALHGMVYLFFVLDLLLAALIMLTFGRRERRRVRRRVSPGGR